MNTVLRGKKKEKKKRFEKHIIFIIDVADA